MRSRFRLMQPSALVWLTVVWVALWGEITVLGVLGGIGVAVLACLVFPLPRLRLAASVRPWPALVLAATFLAEVVWASIQVAGVVLRRRPVRNAVIEVPLRTNSDFVLTGVAAMISLVPGSIVVEAYRSTYTLYLHVLDVPDAAAAERARAHALAVERRFVAAFPPLVEAQTAEGSRS